MKSQPGVDVVGIAGILPIDYTFFLHEDESLEDARSLLKSIPPPFPGLADIDFRYSSFHQAGGGKVPNILAFLAGSGHPVQMWGAVGADEQGDLVLDDLRQHGVGTDLIKQLPDKRTRAVFIPTQLGVSNPKQVHRKPDPLAKPNWAAARLPPARILVIGRANKTVGRLARTARESPGALVVFQLPSVHWRDNWLAPVRDLLEATDVLIARHDDLLRLAEKLQTGSVGKLLPSANNERRLIVSYGNNGQVTFAVHAHPEEEEEEFELERMSAPLSPPSVEVRDATGMMDSFTGAFLSFVLQRQMAIEDPFVVRAALGFGEECAALVGTGIGARHFPSRSWRETLFARYEETIPIDFLCFISHSSGDKETAGILARHLRDQPRIDVWLDNILGGQPLDETIRRGVRDCNALILVLTQQALTSEWVKLEVETAASESMIIPVIPTTNETGGNLLVEASKRFPVLHDLRVIPLPCDADGREHALRELVASVRLASPLGH